MSANVLALSQENRRFLSFHGQISCKAFPQSKPMAPGSRDELIARRRRDPDAPGKFIVHDRVRRRKGVTGGERISVGAPGVGLLARFADCYLDVPFIEGEGKMSRQIAAALCSVVLCSGALGLMASSSPALAQQRAARACLEEWQAAKAAIQSNGLTERAFLAQCRAGGASTQPTPATAAAVSGNAATDRHAYTSIKDIMESIIDPSADALWGAVGTVVDKEGIHELLPKTPEEWLDVRRAAVRIIEGGNLLMMPGREAAPAGTKSETPGVELEPFQIAALIKKKRKAFNGFAQALQLLGLEVLRASDTKDVVLLQDIGGRMENVCESCHQTFWYPQEKPASTRN